ncbi:transglycosylase domain-containing protein [Thermocatellispora tengchongensis]
MAGLVVFSAGIFGMIAVAYANTPVPSYTQDDVDDQGSVIYYDDGKVLAKLGVKRIPVTFDQIPKQVQDAVIAAENRSFREDNGIDFRGMVRSLWSTVSGQQVQGASTITQQMARNYYGGLSQEVSINRKVKEIFVAIKLDQTLTKEEILTQYLNTIYFGRGAHGIGAAAQEFFHKSVKELTPEQAAYLAGRIQNPDRFDRAEIAGNLAPTEERYDYVIGGMAELFPEEYGSLPTKSPTAPKRVAYKQRDVYKGLNGYMITEVLEEMEKHGISKEDVEKGGYRIYSTFNQRLMKIARDAVVNNTAGLPKQIRTGLAAVDPRNGRLRAFYGGKNFATDQWNEATMSQKQAASAFKPYVLAAWLNQGYSLDSYLPGSGSVKLEGTTPITNDHNVGPSVNVINATAQSVNTAYAKMAEKVGLDAVIDIAAGAGLDRERLEDAESRHHYLISIGSSQVTPVEQAAGYSIFANQGRHYETHTIIKVLNKDKMVVFKEPSTYKQVISPEAAADAVAALEAVVKSGTGRGAALYNRPVAGKTGTNNENKEAWFVGFAPQLSTAVGMYKEVNGKEVSLGNIQGASYPTKVWRAFMAEALKNAKVEQFPPRANVGTPENLAPKPTPTPTPEDTEPTFPEDDTATWPPTVDDDGGIDEEPTDESRDCLPWDGSCDVGGGEDQPWGGGVPSTTPQNADSYGREPEDG